MALTLEKTGAAIKANSTSQPMRSAVQGEHGQVQIRPGTDAFGPVRCEPDAKPRIIKVFATSEMAIVNKMRQAVEDMFDVMRRLPRVGLGLVRSQLGALSPSGLGDEPLGEPTAGAEPTASEISLMECTFAALMGENARDHLGVKLVVGVALNIPWKRLMAEDPKRRSRQFLAYLRNNCLWRMAHSEPGQRALALVDKSEVYKVDRNGH